MASILSESDRAAIVARLRKLDPTRPPLWGEMNAGQMVCHLADSLRVAYGEIPCRQIGNVLMRTLVKWLVVYGQVKAPPGKIKTMREMQSTQPASWDDDVAKLVELIERLPRVEKLFPHPAFGNMSRGEWGRLAANHVDHHLRQFGV
ncbi:MAG: DinB family protein [Thermoanaerobaculia bacterium]|nr:DinB family protein [Thermoanaerobaculia bacterium]